MARLLASFSFLLCLSSVVVAQLRLPMFDLTENKKSPHQPRPFPLAFAQRVLGSVRRAGNRGYGLDCENARKTKQTEASEVFGEIRNRCGGMPFFYLPKWGECHPPKESESVREQRWASAIHQRKANRHASGGGRAPSTKEKRCGERAAAGARHPPKKSESVREQRWASAIHQRKNDAVSERRAGRKHRGMRKMSRAARRRYGRISKGAEAGTGEAVIRRLIQSIQNYHAGFACDA